MKKLYVYNRRRSFELLSETKDYWEISFFSGNRSGKNSEKFYKNETSAFVFDNEQITEARAKKANIENLKKEIIEKIFNTLADKRFLSAYMFSVSFGFMSITIRDNSTHEPVTINIYDVLYPRDVFNEASNKFKKLYEDSYIILHNSLNGREYFLRKDKIYKTSLAADHFIVHFSNKSHSEIEFLYPSEQCGNKFLELLSNEDMKFDISTRAFYIKQFVNATQKTYEKAKKALVVAQNEYEKFKKIYDSLSDEEKLLGELYEKS